MRRYMWSLLAAFGVLVSALVAEANQGGGVRASGSMSSTNSRRCFRAWPLSSPTRTTGHFVKPSRGPTAPTSFLAFFPAATASRPICQGFKKLSREDVVLLLGTTQTVELTARGRWNRGDRDGLPRKRPRLT